MKIAASSIRPLSENALQAPGPEALTQNTRALSPSALLHLRLPVPLQEPLCVSLPGSGWRLLQEATCDARLVGLWDESGIYL